MEGGSAVNDEMAGNDVAFYYPGPVWYSTDAMKSLLLFFDGIALLVPDYIRDKPRVVHPELSEPLLELGLLHVLEPETHVDQDAAERLAEALAALIADGVFDRLAKDEGEFHELSMSRLGYGADEGLANMLFEELKARGLARESEDGFSIPMHREVRVLILVLLSQILRPAGTRLGLELLPTTDRPELVGSLTELLSVPSLPSAGTVVYSDLETVGVNLGSVPLDEILDYRRQHHVQYRGYARGVREFVRHLSVLEPDAREAALADRLEELSDVAADLRRLGRSAWRKPASLALAGSGAVWSVTTGDPLGAILGLTGTLLGETLEGARTPRAGAFSYLFAMPRHMYA